MQVRGMRRVSDVSKILLPCSIASETGPRRGIVGRNGLLEIAITRLEGDSSDTPIIKVNIPCLQTIIAPGILVARDARLLCIFISRSTDLDALVHMRRFRRDYAVAMSLLRPQIAPRNCELSLNLGWIG